MEATIAGDPAVRVIRIANPLAAPLTVPRIAFQIGDTDPADVAASLAVAFAEDASERSIVLIVQNAETLDDAALRWLQELPETTGPGVLRSILLVGSPGSVVLAEDERFADLREASPPAPPDSAPPDAAPPDVAPPDVAPPDVAPEPIRRLPARPPLWRRYGAIGAAAILAVLAAVAILAAVAGLMHRDAGGPAPAEVRPSDMASPGTSPPPPGSVPAASPDTAVIPPIAGPSDPPPAASAAEMQAGDAERAPPDPEAALARLRSEFDQFLDRAGRDTASLSEAQRGALFQEYLEWRRQPVSGAEAPAP